MVKEFNYFGDFFGSFKDAFRKPVVFLPFAAILLLTLIFNISLNFIGLEAAITEAGVDTATLTYLVIVFVILMLITWYLYASGIYGAKILVTGKKLSAENIFGGGAKIYFRYVGMSVLRGIIYLIPLTPVIIVLYHAVQPVFSGVSDQADGGLALLGLALLLVYILLAIVLYILFLFSEVLISLKNSGPWRALRDSFLFLKNNFGHVLMTFLVIFLLWLSIIAITVTISVVFALLTIMSPGLESLFDIINNFLTGVISMITQPVLLIYLFKSFKSKKPELLR